MELIDDYKTTYFFRNMGSDIPVVQLYQNKAMISVWGIDIAVIVSET